MKQATLYSAYCAEKAEAKKKDSTIKSHWEEDDFRSLNLDKYLVDVEVVTGEKKEIKIFYNFVQDWEKETIKIKAHHSEILLRNKYGGIQYYDIDTDKGRFESRTIDMNRVAWQNKKEDKCYFVVGRVDHLPEEHVLKEEEWEIGDDLHYSIRTFYRRNPDPNIRLITEVEFTGKNGNDDYLLVDEWISNGGFFSTKLEVPKRKRKDKTMREKRKHSEKASTKKMRKPSAPRKSKRTVEYLSESSDEQQEEPRKRRATEVIELKESDSDTAGSDASGNE
jgi:hypothetical protein